MEQHFCATACIVNKNTSKILFVFHKKLQKWLFVGGHINDNESPEEAVLREVKEETNLDVNLLGERYPREDDFIKPFAMQRNIINDKHIHMDIFYIAIAENPNELKLEESEVERYKWYSKEEIVSENFDTFPEKKKMAIDAIEYVNSIM